MQLFFKLLCRSAKWLLTSNSLLAMRLTTLLILAAVLQVSARGYTQTVTISLKNAPLEKVFAEIKKQTGYSFIYTDQMLEGAHKVNINVKSATLETVLELCLKNQPLSYTLVNKTVVLQPKEKSPNGLGVIPGPDPESLSTIDVTGKVTDVDGNPLSGANVKIKDTDKGTTTNSNGVFILKGVDEQATLEISYIGYQTTTIAVDSRTSITASLKINPAPLNEVIINKGYYTEKQKTSVSNVNTVTAKDIEKQPVNNALQAIQGRVPGVFIMQPSGISGGSIKITIQGQNSILNGNLPLYVIDGVPIISDLPTTGLDKVLRGGLGPNFSGYGNPLNYIDISSIERIDVLKDADATAIYGSRAANGAILITTKKGKAGPMRFDLNMQTGWGKVSSKLDMLNTRQYLDMRYEAFKNDGIDWRDPSVSANDLKVWDTTKYTDWQKELIGGTARVTNINASVSGGTDVVRYLIGGAYQKQTTVFPISNDFADTKGSVNFNINANSLNQKFRLQFTGNYMYDRNQLPQVDLTQAALLMEPNSPALYNQDGSINWAPDVSGTSTFVSNPMLFTLSRYWNKTSNLISNLNLGYKISPGLEISSSFGFNSLQTTDFNAQPLTTFAPEIRTNAQRSASYGNRNVNSWIVEPQVNYKRNISQGSLEVLLGSTLLNLNTNAGNVQGIGHLNDDLLENMNAAASIIKGISSASEYKYNAGFARANYNWKEKYILNFSGRRDGSSRFGEANQFHNFGSVGVGWIFSNESFVNKNLGFLSFGKLRGGYGTTGNDQIGDYQFLSLYNYPAIDVPYQGVVSLRPAGLPNPHLQWEETRKLQLGLDLNFLKDKIALSATFVQNRSSNQLLSYQIPTVTGYSGYLLNFPATIQNRSWEFLLNSKNINNKDFTWVSSCNLTVPQNKLISFPNLSASTYANQLIIGEPIQIRKVLHYIGADPTTGRAMFQSKTDAFNPKYPDDYTVLVDINPKYYGGLQNTFTYKQFELDFLFQFVKQVGFNDALFWNGILAPGSFDPGLSNQPVSVLQRWQKVGDITNVTKFATIRGYPATIASDYRFMDASYIRLRNASFSWEMPRKILDKIHFNRCKLYVHGQNLLTFTKYKGLDPENQSILTAALPPLRVITTGIQLGF